MGAIGEDAKQGWLDNPHMVPKDSQVFASLAKVEKLKEEQEKVKEIKEDRHNDIKKYIISGIAFLLLL